MRGLENTKHRIVEKYEWLRDKAVQKVRTEIEENRDKLCDRLKRLPFDELIEQLQTKNHSDDLPQMRMLAEAWKRWSALSW